MKLEMIKERLDKLEFRLQALIEGSSARLYPSELRKIDLSHQLISAMQKGIKSDPDDNFIAPNTYIITLNPQQIQLFTRDDDPGAQLVDSIAQFASEASLIFLSEPKIEFRSDSDIPWSECRVDALIEQSNLAQTSDILHTTQQQSSAIPIDAYLILNGTDMIPLKDLVLNIGRRPDNHIVIDDNRVSRIHAQLRAINNRYVVFDLQSTGGTFVNNNRIDQAILAPGDVLSLAGFPLLFGQEETPISSTQRYSPDQE
jgi:hypothetical protein